MSGVLTRARLIAQERYDLEDLVVDQNATKTDAKFWTRQFLSNKNYILKGFQVTGIGLKSATVLMTNATLIHPENTFDFSWFTAEESPTDIIVPDASLQDGVKNYLELRLVEETNTPVTKAFWDPAANSGEGAEFNQEIDTIVDLAVEVVASTGGFTGDPDRIPLAIVEVDGSGNIVGILDKRDRFFRLESDFTWGSQDEPDVTLTLSSVTGTFTEGETITFGGGATAIVTQGGTTSIKANTFSSDSFNVGNGVTGSDSGATGTLDNYSEDFSGADKDIDNFKEALDATWTEIKAIKGTDKWFNVVNSSLSGIASKVDSQIAAEIKGAIYRWNGSDFSITEILRPEITSILARADVGGDLDGTYFITYDQNGSVGWWIDVDDSGTTIPAGAAAADRNVEITTIATGDSIGDVATKLQAATNADSEYTSTLDNDTVILTDSVNGPRAQAADGDTGFTITRVQEGLGNLTPADADVIAKLRLFGTNNELDLTRQDGTGGSAAIPVGDQQVVFIKIPTDATDRVFSGIGVADTNYQVIDADLYEPNDEHFWIAYRENEELYVRGLGRLQSGDESSIGGGVTEDTLAYIGANSPTDSTPNYPSSEIVTQGANLTQSIGDLDAAAAGTQLASRQNVNLKLVGGGTWNWDLGTTTLSLSATANVMIGGLANTVNSIAAGNIVLASDGQVAYVEVNRTAPGGALTVNVTDVSSVVLTDNTVILARRVGDIVIVGTSSFMLKDGEYLELDGALAEINRYFGQLQITPHESDGNKVRVSGADIDKLNASVLGQATRNLLLKFSGAVIDFTTGVITESDGVTPLGIDFTPFSIGSSEFFWYSITLVAAAANADNTIGGQILVLPAANSGVAVDLDTAKDSSAVPKAPFASGIQIGQVIVEEDGGGGINALTFDNVIQLGVGGGSGSGTGDANSDLTRYQDRLNLAPYEYANTNVAAIDEDDQLDTSTASFDIPTSTFKFAENTAQELVSLQQLDAEFLDEEVDVNTVELYGIWELDNIDDSAIYEISRDGGNNYQAINMNRIGLSDSFRGLHTFTEEGSNAFNQEYAVAEADATKILTDTTEQKVSQKITVANTTVFKDVFVYLNKASGAVGKFCVELVRDDSGAPSVLPNDVVWTSASQNIADLADGS
jgi:hypothetical protein